MARYTHVLDLAFEIETDLNEDELFNEENFDIFVKSVRQRLARIQNCKDIEAFGLVDTYENDTAQQSAIDTRFI